MQIYYLDLLHLSWNSKETATPEHDPADQSEKLCKNGCNY